MITRDHTLYFGRTKRFVDNNGNVYEKAFNVVDSQTDVITKTITLRSIFYSSIESFNEGGIPIAESDGGIRKIVYRAESWDKFMFAHGQLSAQTAMALHGVFDAIQDTPKGDGSYESFFADASEIILPQQ